MGPGHGRVLDAHAAQVRCKASSASPAESEPWEVEIRHDDPGLGKQGARAEARCSAEGGAGEGGAGGGGGRGR